MNGALSYLEFPARRARAFTLLELLMALVVFSIVLGAIHVVFFSAMRLRNRTNDAIERALPLQQTMAIIQRDLANLVPPNGALSGALQSTPNLSATTTGIGAGKSGGMASMSTRSSGPQFYTASAILDDNFPWAEVQRVSYHLQPSTNSSLGQDLYRTVARNLLPVMQDDSEDQYLMGGVSEITFQYYDGTANAWKDTWDSTLADLSTGLSNNLPRAIKVQLQLRTEGGGLAAPAPVQLVVPVLAQARTNILLDVGGTNQ